ncbi:Bacterial alpha-L-rhamnosidase [Ginsengibacter hankyongi]|uniref:alpha-L-rhamnosidase n=1 Tax=Ginsengibacter hankyongi TaxID=2607284 RepID=A0A5J5ILF7_9BACT|nr:alpha-L-rhamnosidase C-terminal domain-containing protein [Ginsengibacter hankyongi]KAA9041193.1 Bacterial alpha-L-rhamnosidase [Ginsengibacter hankyongi]
MKRPFISILLITFTCSATCQVLPAPNRLRCDFLLHTNQVSQHGMPVTEPLTSAINKKNKYQFAPIYSQQPIFNWEVDTLIKDVSAWRILVASSPRLLNKNQADYWDSKKVKTSGTHSIYNGRPLIPGILYYWKVAVWNGKDVATSFSDNAVFYLSAKDSSDNISHYPLSASIQSPATIFKKDDNSYFLDFGKDGFAQLQLHLTSETSDSIWIEAAEALKSDHELLNTNGNIRYIKIGMFLKKGAHDYIINWPANEKRNHRNSPILMPDYIGEVFPFRYVTIKNFKGKLYKESVKRKMIFYPFDDSASNFISSDSILNKVWDLCRYSEKATSFTGYYVDGDRERVPYEADALINQLSHYTVDPEYSMARRSMAYVIYHPTWPTEWSLQNILLAWNDYMYTGDDLFLEKYYTELQKKLLMPLAGNNGLISTRTNKQTPEFLESIHFPKSFDDKKGLRDNVDWPHGSHYIGSEKEYDGEQDGFVFNNYNAVVNAYYYRALVLMQKIALVLEKKADAQFYEEKAKGVYQSFQNVFKNPETGLIKDGDSTDHSSLHANMFALAFGLVPKNDIDRVVAFIKTRKMACSVYGAQFLLDALYDNNEGVYALTLLDAATQRSWYNMIRSGSTITMEAWDKLYKPNLDWNHAWGAAPANIIVREMMGIKPLTPAFETFQIKPQLGSLSFAQLKTPTIKGAIFVSYKKDTSGDVMEVTVPGNTKANIYIPYNSSKPGLFIDGKNASIKPENNFFLIKNVSAGKHYFITK